MRRVESQIGGWSLVELSGREMTEIESHLFDPSSLGSPIISGQRLHVIAQIARARLDNQSHDGYEGES